MEIIYQDPQVLVCVKPFRVLSTDEPGGLPELLRRELGDPNANVRTVHRLDRVVGGLMVLGRTARAASDLSRDIREDRFQKEYLAVVHGCPAENRGTLRDLLLRENGMTRVVTEKQKDAKEAILDYQVLESREGLSLVRIRLVTGRTHQIRVQFSSRGLPLWGDRKYGNPEDEGEIALWSHRLGFFQPKTREHLEFTREPPEHYPWTLFSSIDFSDASKA